MTTYEMALLRNKQLEYRKMALLCRLFPPHEYKAQLRNYAALGAWVCLAYDEDQIVGTAGYMPSSKLGGAIGLGLSDAELQTHATPSLVYVAESHEGQGVGTRLLEMLYAHARNTGIKSFLHMGFKTPDIVNFMYRDTWHELPKPERHPYGVFTETL